MIRRILIAAGVLVVMYGVVQVLLPRRVVEGNEMWLRPGGGRPLLIAHGGGQGLQPPNTLEAFEAAVESGCDVLEMDIRLTRDGVLVTIHDATVDRTSDGKGKVLDLDLAQLKGMNFGARFKDPSGMNPYGRGDRQARIATLEEVFQRFGKLRMIVELKDRGEDGARSAGKLAELLKRHSLESSVMVASFDDAVLEVFREASGGRVRMSCGMGVAKKVVILNRLGLDWFAPTGFEALHIPVEKLGYRLDTAGLIGAAHRRNVAVHYWTVDDPDEMKRLIGLGADGLMTDRPDLMIGVLKELGWGGEGRK